MEIAGMMYGISLNNDGTTKVVAQRLENDERAPEAPASDEPVVAVPATEALSSPPVG
jgi:hypothetical protein